MGEIDVSVDCWWIRTTSKGYTKVVDAKPAMVPERIRGRGEGGDDEEGPEEGEEGKGQEAVVEGGVEGGWGVIGEYAGDLAAIPALIKVVAPYLG